MVVSINAAFFLNIHISSGSMEPTMATDSYSICDRQIYRHSEPQRYDIIVFRYPLDKNLLYIKRIIGLPGEHVEIIDGEIYINHQNEPISEDYLKEKWSTDNNGYIFDIPKDCYLVLGDNKNNSYDTRYWRGDGGDDIQYVRREDILAKVWFQYLPELSGIR